VAALLVASCRPEGVTIVAGSDLPSEVYGSPEATPAVTPEEALPNRATVYLVRDGRLQPVPRTLQRDVAASLQEALMVALLTSAPLPRRGISSEIPEITRLLGVDVEGRVATVDLSSEFGQGTGESLALRLAQVVYTLTEEPSNVIGVRLEIDGFPEPVVEPDRPTNRGDFREFAPQPGN
jgi:spore germination protein GerM